MPRGAHLGKRRGFGKRKNRIKGCLKQWYGGNWEGCAAKNEEKNG